MNNPESIFEGLSFTDIFVGGDGAPVLVSSMLLALAGNLLKKHFRYKSVSYKNPFDLTKWLYENWLDMLVGLFVTYILVRLLNVMSIILFNLDFVKALVPDIREIPVSEILIIVSIFIGYYTDKIMEKAFSIKPVK